MPLDWMQAALDNFVLWLLIVIGDAMVFTFFYHHMSGKWWWKKPEKKPTDWEFTIGADGWTLRGTDRNPLITFAKMYRDLQAKVKEVEQDGKEEEEQ